MTRKTLFHQKVIIHMFRTCVWYNTILNKSFYELAVHFFPEHKKLSIFITIYKSERLVSSPAQTRMPKRRLHCHVSALWFFLSILSFIHTTTSPSTTWVWHSEYVEHKAQETRIWCNLSCLLIQLRGWNEILMV